MFNYPQRCLTARAPKGLNAADRKKSPSDGSVKYTTAAAQVKQLTCVCKKIRVAELSSEFGDLLQ